MSQVFKKIDFRTRINDFRFQK